MTKVKKKKGCLKSMMFGFIIIIGSIILGVNLASTPLANSTKSSGSSGKPAKEDKKGESPNKELQDEIVKYFQSSEEPTAKDAIWTADDIFKVGVIDDGTRRDGYAQYVGEILSEKGFAGQKVWIQIVDIVKLKKDGKWIKLGEYHTN